MNKQILPEMSWDNIFQYFKIGYKVRSTGVYILHCVSHMERTSSLVCWSKSGQFRCHGCGAKGNKLDFIALVGHGQMLKSCETSALNSLLTLVYLYWNFDSDNYSSIERDQDGDKAFKFAVNHILKHEVTVVGLLAKECEKVDHSGETLDKEVLVTVTRRMLIHSLRLGLLLGMSAKDFQQEIENWAKQIEESG